MRTRPGVFPLICHDMERYFKYIYIYIYVRGARADCCRGGDIYGIEYTGDSMHSYMRVVQGTRRTTMRELWAAIAHAEG